MSVIYFAFVFPLSYHMSFVNVGVGNVHLLEYWSSCTCPKPMNIRIKEYINNILLFVVADKYIYSIIFLLVIWQGVSTLYII